MALVQRMCAYGIARDANDAVLLCRAAPTTDNPGIWWLPGGGIDHGEHPEEGLIREFREETNLMVDIDSFAGVLSDTRVRANGAVVHTVRLIYNVTVTGGTLRSEVRGSTDYAAWIDATARPGIEIAPYVLQALAGDFPTSTTRLNVGR